MVETEGWVKVGRQVGKRGAERVWGFECLRQLLPASPPLAMSYNIFIKEFLRKKPLFQKVSKPKNFSILCHPSGLFYNPLGSWVFLLILSVPCSPFLQKNVDVFDQNLRQLIPCKWQIMSPVTDGRGGSFFVLLCWLPPFIWNCCFPPIFVQQVLLPQVPDYIPRTAAEFPCPSTWGCLF